MGGGVGISSLKCIFIELTIQDIGLIIFVYQKSLKLSFRIGILTTNTSFNSL